MKSKIIGILIAIGVVAMPFTVLAVGGVGIGGACTTGGGNCSVDPCSVAYTCFCKVVLPSTTGVCALAVLAGGACGPELLCHHGLTCTVSVCVAPAGDGCAVVSPEHTLTLEQITAISNMPEGSDVNMSCQDLTADVSPDTRLQRCISNACPHTGTNTMCCLPGTGTDRGRTPTDTTAPAGGGGGSALRLVMPECTAKGDCGLNDIVQMGVNFANFLFGISGAIFLAIFVYAGFKYIFFAAQASEAKSSKDMLVNATIGIILMFGASALVTTIYNSARTGDAGGSASSKNAAGDARCAAAFPGNTCQSLRATWTDVPEREAEITSRACQKDLCGANNQFVCCPTAGGVGRDTSGPRGTCTCNTSFIGGIAAGEATAEQLGRARTACVGQGGTFTESPLSCIGPSTQAECTQLNTVIREQTRISEELGSLASCSWAAR